MGKKSKKVKSNGKGGSSFVLMQSEMPPYDDSLTYSVDDDPYKGRRKPVNVEFMALDLKVCDRCQGTDKRVEVAVEKLRDVLSACGYDIALTSTIIDNEWMAEEYRFYSSPTIRVNGVDICPSIEENECKCCSDMSDSPVKCRMYPFNGTYYEVPPVDLVIQGIMNVVAQELEADPQAKPYALPENLKVFFGGVREKAKADGSEGESCCCGPDCC